MKTLTKLLVLFFFLITSLLVSTQITLINAQPPLNDAYAYFHMIPNPDGSITRIKEFYPTVPPNTSTNIAFSRDVPLNPVKKTWVRLYLPNNPEIKNLPIIVFAHGGMFIVLSTAAPDINSYLTNTASELNVLVVSVEYRLAPEHRLPAAYDDVLEALYWIKEKKDEWVQKYGDVSKCIMMGDSVGGNIAYNVGLRASDLTRVLNPLVIRGLVLIQPFFGSITDPSNVPPMMDFVWRSSLPIGANLDNPYFNPMFRGGSRNLDKIKRMGWRIAIMGCDGDFLFAEQVEVFKFLEKRRVNVIGNFGKGLYHGVFVGNSNKAQELYQFVRHVFSPYISS